MHARGMAGAVAVAGMLAGAAFAAAPTPVGGKRMRNDEPMKTGMMKPGMKLGDVKKAAEKKDLEMKSLMERESAAAKRTQAGRP